MCLNNIVNIFIFNLKFMENIESLILVLTRVCSPCACNYCNVLKKDSFNFWDEIYKDEKYFEYIVLKLLKIIDEQNIDSIRFF